MGGLEILKGSEKEILSKRVHNEILKLLEIMFMPVVLNVITTCLLAFGIDLASTEL